MVKDSMDNVCVGCLTGCLQEFKYYIREKMKKRTTRSEKIIEIDKNVDATQA